LRDPACPFRPRWMEIVKTGLCGVLIAEKLGSPGPPSLSDTI